MGSNSRLPNSLQNVDPRARLLFISHLGASTVTVFDLVSECIRVNIAPISDVHEVLVIPELGRVYASATDENQVEVIDEQKLAVLPALALVCSAHHGTHVSPADI